MSIEALIQEEIKKDNERRKKNLYGNDDARRFRWSTAYEELFTIFDKHNLDIMDNETLCSLCVALGLKNQLRTEDEVMLVSSFTSTNEGNTWKKTRCYGDDRLLMMTAGFHELSSEDNDIDLGYLETHSAILDPTNEYLEAGLKYLIMKLDPYIQVKDGKIISTIGTRKAEFAEFFLQFVNNECGIQFA